MQQFFEFPLHTVATFENFIVCDGNASALQFSRRIADPDESENLLYLYGPSGSGKSHLVSAIRQQLALHFHQQIPLISCSVSITPHDFSSCTESSPVLLIDNLHLLPDDSALRGAVWQVFNDFHTTDKKIVITGNCPPRELPFLDDHLTSRLLWGLVARVDASDDHSRRMILKKIADDRNVRIPDDVIDYILVTTSREVGDLIATFEKLYRLSLASARKISLQLARKSRETGYLGRDA